ncbi:dihydrolipoamide acetyltransferase component of pyruvate dehydrogenase complex [Hydrangea phyllody phytoplasma]|uniref:Dihydrolipoamide acetyltransferase component of pyruvate dehydrogenase complex n=1 Tax=Hydrangea phyllody phytoplasma TaxID=238673 RepID=A0ABQ1EJV4_9MOLU|nr:dihydrolipoamide acetyltransferase family protein [Hydrangea phyllody phytoplasma]GFZ75441.1 dihydrolipoamide acetyltransferase component of pyruvate dehydrogenase complex [Hydrangea phyllody phytoplasma]GLH61907.1 dihydrolipoamide acetyltransferase component of pyruvate dehydrogenase complex [Hydrangea phyllody phytoplasma]
MFEFKFADVGEGIHEGTITRWFFKVGDQVKEGDVLVKVETDKLDVELTSPVAGKILKRDLNEGEVICVGDTIVLIQESGDTDADVKKFSSQNPNETAATEKNDTQQAQTSAQTSLPPQKVLATPLVKSLAKELGLDLSTIKGTGVNGKILKVDVQNATNPLQTQPQPKTPFVQEQPTPTPTFATSSQETEVVKISRLRKAIAQKMVLSKGKIPETTLMDEVNITALVTLRKQAKDQAQSQGIKLTFMAFIMKAVAIALQEFPVFNASYDDVKEEVTYKKFINLGVAVDTKDGLIVPNIKDANKLTLLEMAQQLQQVAKATTERKVELNQLQNGTFTITNFGSIDITYGTPVINYPELAILGVGKITKKPVVENSQIVIADMLPLSLAIDHRIIDGADGGRFLKRVKELLNTPTLLLLS